MIDVHGKRVLVVGGTSGIGREIASQFARNGAAVTAVSRQPAQVRTAYEALIRQGVASLEIACDVTEPAQVRSMFQTIAETWSGLDVVVNSQGIHYKERSTTFSDALFAEVLQVNLQSVFTVCREAYDLLKASGGTIINIASMASFLGLPDAAAYTASKGGVAQLTKALAVDWAADGIRCNAIAPGWIKTPLSEKALSSPQYAEPILRRIPMGRFGEVQDVAGLALFLASDQARYITGAIIPVDGGVLAGI